MNLFRKIYTCIFIGIFFFIVTFANVAHLQKNLMIKHHSDRPQQITSKHYKYASYLPEETMNHQKYPNLSNADYVPYVNTDSGFVSQNAIQFVTAVKPGHKNKNLKSKSDPTLADYTFAKERKAKSQIMDIPISTSHGNLTYQSSIKALKTFPKNCRQKCQNRFKSQKNNQNSFIHPQQLGCCVNCVTAACKKLWMTRTPESKKNINYLRQASYIIEQIDFLPKTRLTFYIIGWPILC
jgi:hypothetical protein